MCRHPPAQRLRERSLWGAQPKDRPAGAAPAARPPPPPPPPPWPRPGRPFKAAAQRPHVPAPRHFRRAPRLQPMGERARPPSPPPGSAQCPHWQWKLQVPARPARLWRPKRAWSFLSVQGDRMQSGAARKESVTLIHSTSVYLYFESLAGGTSRGFSRVTTPCLEPNPPHSFRALGCFVHKIRISHHLQNALIRGKTVWRA